MQSNDARILRGAAIATSCVGLVAVAAGAVTAGAPGAVGAMIGTVLVVSFFGLGLYGLSRVGERRPELFLGAGLVIYTTQILVLLVLLRVFRDVTFMDGLVFGLAMIACALVWLAGQAWLNVRAKTPYIQPGSARAPADTEVHA
jgi:ATP synthase protein I